MISLAEIRDVLDWERRWFRRASQGVSMNFKTHEQAMACLSCGLAGVTPEKFFPQEPGLWDQPCPQCGAMTVWVTEPRERTPPPGNA
jgi:hypothetical protein